EVCGHERDTRNPVGERVISQGEIGRGARLVLEVVADAQDDEKIRADDAYVKWAQSEPHSLSSPPSCASAAASPAASAPSGRSCLAPRHASRWPHLSSPDAAAPPLARPISAAPPRSSPVPPRR